MFKRTADAAKEQEEALSEELEHRLEVVSLESDGSLEDRPLIIDAEWGRIANSPVSQDEKEEETVIPVAFPQRSISHPVESGDDYDTESDTEESDGSLEDRPLIIDAEWGRIANSPVSQDEKEEETVIPVAFPQRSISHPVESGDDYDTESDTESRRISFHDHPDEEVVLAYILTLSCQTWAMVPFY
nr:hypothetical transcript [Hymenolepis microstoma]